MKILVVAPIIPYPLHDGDKLRFYHLLEGMGRKHEVTLLACSRDPEAQEQAKGLRGIVRECQVIHLSNFQLYMNCIKKLFSQLPFNVSAYLWPEMQRAVDKKLASQSFDLVFAYRLRMAPYVAKVSLPKVLDLTDSMSIYLTRVAKQASPPWKKIFLHWEAAKMRKYEPVPCGQFKTCLISSPEDMKYLESRGVKNLALVRNGVAMKDFTGIKAKRNPDTLLFSGNQGYYPNQQGIADFKEHSWPLIKSSVPSTNLQVVGGNPPAWMQKWNREAGIRVTGRVDQIAPYFKRAAVFICPIQVGSGIRFKLLEAMAAGLPIVTTTLGCEGIGVTPNKEMMVADSPESFAAAVVVLLTSPKMRNKLKGQAFLACQKSFDWPVIQKVLSEVLALAVWGRKSKNARSKRL